MVNEFELLRADVRELERLMHPQEEAENRDENQARVVDFPSNFFFPLTHLLCVIIQTFKSRVELECVDVLYDSVSCDWRPPPFSASPEGLTDLENRIFLVHFSKFGEMFFRSVPTSSGQKRIN